MIQSRTSLLRKLPSIIFAVTAVCFSIVLISCEEKIHPIVLPALNRNITETVIVFPEKTAGSEDVTSAGNSLGTEKIEDSIPFDLLYFLAYKKKDIRKLYSIRIPWKGLPAEFKADGFYPDSGDSDFKGILNRFFGSRIEYVYVDTEDAAEKLLKISRNLSEYKGSVKAEFGDYTSNVWEVLIPQAKYYARKEVFENMELIFNDDVSSAAVRSAFEFLAELGKAPLMVPLEYDKEGIVLYDGSLLQMKIDYMKEFLDKK